MIGTERSSGESQYRKSSELTSLMRFAAGTATLVIATRRGLSHSLSLLSSFNRTDSADMPHVLPKLAKCVTDGFPSVTTCEGEERGKCAKAKGKLRVVNQRGNSAAWRVVPLKGMIVSRLILTLPQLDRAKSFPTGWITLYGGMLRCVSIQRTPL